MGTKNDSVRTLLASLSDEKGISLKELSESAGKNHAYLQQFIKRGSPVSLPEDVRYIVAEALGIDETLLRSDGKLVTVSPKKRYRVTEEFQAIPIYDIRASAGPGAMAEDGEPVGFQPYRDQELQRITRAAIDQLAVIRVAGDSMEPTLNNADQVLVDRTVTKVGRDGIYILALDEDLLVKRCQVDLQTRHIIVKSDNPTYDTMTVTDRERVQVHGRVIWIGRALG